MPENIVKHESPLKNVPWQIWIVVLLLSVEGILGNLPAIPSHPIAATWFAWKCLFIVGLIRRWRWVFVLYLVFGAIHVIGFSVINPFVATVNLFLMILVASTFHCYFPRAIDVEEVGS
jgi:hypothetical protein